MAVSQLPPTAGLQTGVAVAVSQGVWWQSGVGEAVAQTTPGWQVGVAVLLLPSGIIQPLLGTAATVLAGPVIAATAATVLSIAANINRASTMTWTSLVRVSRIDPLLSIARPSFVLLAGEDVPRRSVSNTNSARMWVMTREVCRENDAGKHPGVSKCSTLLITSQ